MKTRHSRTMIVLACTVAAIAAAVPAVAVTYDLHVRPHCAAGSFCDFANESALQQKILDIVEETNRAWETVGISFRPTIFTIDTDPLYAQVPVCATVCDDLMTTCEVNSDCNGIGSGICNALAQALRVDWRQEFAVPNPDAITMMLTQGPNTNCSNIPQPTDSFDALFGLYVDANQNVLGGGGLWAHELGHHFCLHHTFTKQDFPETAPFQPNHDNDSPWGVHDTPDDPCTLEGSDRVLRCGGDGGALCTDDSDCSASETCQSVVNANHEYCYATALPADPGSPQPTYCTVDCVRCTGGDCTANNGPGLTAIPFSPLPQAIMSYYGAGVCTGPYVAGGYKIQGFTQDSIDVINACVAFYSQRSNLPDVCANSGGDTDHDGICSNGDGSAVAGDNPCPSGVTLGCDDNCPNHKNTDQSDVDGDGIGDVCDLCENDPLPTGDLDGDGIGDACDPDSDNDGCPNSPAYPGDPTVDQHPQNAWIQVGDVTYISCSNSVEPTYAFEGDDSDDDGVPNCSDLDDDNDGICDVGGPHPFEPVRGVVLLGGCVAGTGGNDSCPIDPGESVCFQIQAGGPCLPDYISICDITPTCEELALRIYDVVNPVPEVILRSFAILNRTIYVIPQGGQTASEVAISVLGPTQQGSGEGAPFGASALRMEIVEEQSGDLVMVVLDEYSPTAIALGDLNAGPIVAITPFADLAGATVETRWGVGFEADDVFVDSESDGIPAWYDNCTTRYNERQTDADDDGRGNACDGDLDGDGFVTLADVDAVSDCDGADLTLVAPLSEPAGLLPDSFDTDGFETPIEDPAALALTLRCYAADLNEDDVVDSTDIAIADSMLGMPLEPSSQVNLAPVADAGPDGTAACGESITLDGTGSYDPEGSPLSCSWTSGGCTFDDATSCTPDVTCPEGTYTATLTVNDGTSSSTPDSASLSFQCASGQGSIGWSLRLVAVRTNDPPIFGALWEASCTSSTTDYAIYEGLLGDWTSHRVIDCSDGGLPFAEPVGLLGGNDNYYLIVPLGDDEEGSYGTDSSGLERPPATDATCAPVQVLATCP